MHMGNARGGVLGDTLASVLAACGADVTREFYVNEDVYKRQLGEISVDPLHQLPIVFTGQGFPIHVCLLYTSRCV